MNTLFVDEQNGAKFSDDGKHRLALWRIWDNSGAKLMLIGLNPSKADGEIDDPTIRRIKSLAASNGYSGFYMTNLFSYISTDPGLLKWSLEDLKRNDFALKLAKVDCIDVCFCWGNFGQDYILRRATEVKTMFEDAVCFGKNKNGSPKHPLYMKADTKLVKY